MFTEIFVFGGVMFWGLVALELSLLTWYVEAEYGLFSFLSIVLFLTLIHVFGDASVFSYIKNNPLDVFKYAIIYMGLGFGWSLVKFYFHTSKLRRKINVVKEKFIEQYEKELKEQELPKKLLTSKTINTNEDSSTKEDKWEFYLERNIATADKKDMVFSSYSSRILFWLSYWPVSMFWTLLNDPIRRFSSWCYETFLINIYKKIHSSTIGNATKL